MGVSLRSTAGPSTIVGSGLTDALRASLRGPLLTPDSPGYDAARTIWNATVDRHPGLIARCADAADVASAVRFAVANDILISVRGGGHNIAGSAVTDGGLMIDLSPMRGVRMFSDARTVRVEAGATLADVDGATQAAALAVPLGVNSTTGVAGLTLGGGFGWLSRRFGLTIDNLLGADVVTADGDQVRASDAENPELFWAIRGGGGNFGIVTSFDFRLHPVGPAVLAGLVVHPMDRARDVLRFYREFMRAAPDELVCWFVLRKAPPLPFLAPEWHGREILVLAMLWSGEQAEGERVMKPLRSFGTAIADIVQPMPYTGWQTILDPLLAPGMRNYWKTHDLREVSDGLIDTLLEHARRLPDPQAEILVAMLGGAVGRVAPDATAYAHRDAQFVLNVHGRWADRAKDDECTAWTRGLYEAVSPFATGGAYVNFLTQEEGGRVAAAYGGNYQRLRQLKRRFDPRNVFRTNQNIEPAG